MSSNLLKSLLNISKSENNNLQNQYKSQIRANQMGEALELFVQDSFCVIPGKMDESQRDLKYSSVFSYLANQNNPHTKKS